MKKFKIIQKKQFGHEIVCEMVVITPIDGIYNILNDHYSSQSVEYKGMYRNFLIDGRVLVVKSPQGVQAQDVIDTFQNKSVLFVGYAGSLGAYEIGSVFAVSEAVLPDGKRISLPCLENLKIGICGYSPALLGVLAKKYQDRARHLGCDCVDMEIAYCANNAGQNEFYALVLITDKPGETEFWELDDSVRDRLLDGPNEFIRIVISYMDEWLNRDKK